MTGKKMLQLVVGLFLIACGIVFTLKAELGYGPWDVFHMGLVDLTSLSIGTISIITSLMVVLSNYFFLQMKLGVATLLNVVFIGVFMDLLLYFSIIPTPSGLFMRYIYLFFGMIIIAYATFLYIQPGLGAGPRDTLVIGLMRKYNWSLIKSRIVTEGSVLLAGVLLGQKPGIGTVIFCLLLGPLTSLLFHFIKFDIAKVEHLSFKF